MQAQGKDAGYLVDDLRGRAQKTGTILDKASPRLAARNRACIVRLVKERRARLRPRLAYGQPQFPCRCA